MIEKADIQIASINWTAWKDVFEHAEAVYKNPLLTDQALFNIFTKDYSVARTIRKGCRDQLREELRTEKTFMGEPIHDVPGFLDVTGRGVDILDQKLRVNYGTGDPPRSLRSILSKIAAFLAPSSFVAWDKYARIGLNIKTHRARGYIQSTYKDYLQDFNCFLNGGIEAELDGILNEQYPIDDLFKEGRFKRRVLDVYLMRIGGRQF